MHGEGQDAKPAGPAGALDPEVWGLPVQGRHLPGGTLGEVCPEDEPRPVLLVFLRHFG